MTQFPPAVPPPDVGYAPSAPQPANVLAIVSLICGILGCFVVTPIIAIITGALALGRVREQGGRGMAMAGIILGVLWVVGGLGLGGVTYWGMNKFVAPSKQAATDTINALVDGDLPKVQQLSTLDPAAAQALSDTLKPYGRCTAVTVRRFDSKYDGNGMRTTIGGTATFDKAGGKGFEATAAERGGKWLVEKLRVD